MTSDRKDDRLALLSRAIEQKKASRASGTAMPQRPLDQPAVLGEMQQGLWVLHRMAPASAAYNLASTFRLSDALDTTRLEHSLNTIVDRHRLLRSTFQSHRDTALQIVHATKPVRVEIAEAAEGRALETATLVARRPFDLLNGPLIRMCVIEDRSTPERLAVLVLHHILADERSLGRLWQELADAYNGRPDTGAPTLQYDDYVYWSAGARGDRGQELAYWRSRLDPRPGELVLPFEKPSDGSPPLGRLKRRTLGQALKQRVRLLAAGIEATPFVVYAFAFRLLLERYLPQQAVAFATPVSTRSHPATGDMLGYFLNPVVVPTSVDEGSRVDEGLRAFARDVRGLLSHASIPFHVLARELHTARRPDRHPLFQVMFVFQEPFSPPSLGGVQLNPVTLDLGTSKFDLTLLVSESDDSVDVAVEYRADRFDDVWMGHLLGHYATLLEHLDEAPERTVSEVPMLTAAEEQLLRTGWQGAAIDTSAAPLLPQQILAHANRSPDTPAVTCGGSSLSYADLRRTSTAIAHELVRHGAGPGNRAGVLLDRSVLLVAGLLGSQLAGAAYVPLDPSYPPDHTRESLEDAGVAAVITTGGLSSKLSRESWPTICIDTLDADRPVEGSLPEVVPTTPAYILYTSGSTGRPKGVVITHGNLRASTAARFDVYDQLPERFLLVPSVAFDSSVAGIFWTLAAGGTLVVPTDDDVRDARRLAQLVADQHVTTLLCVPTLYAQMLRFGGERLRGLTTAIVAGEPCGPQLVREHFRALPATRLFNEYGPTEATVWATVQELTARDVGGPIPIGRPIPGVRVDVLDSLGRPVPAGIPGQGFIAGPTVADGYWRRPDLTADRFVVAPGVPPPYERRYRSGDRLTRLPDGRLLFLGRDDDQVKIRGVRIEPGEVEAVLLDHPNIGEAAVVARPVGPAGTAPSGSPPPTHLVAFFRAKTPGAAQPTRRDFSERLPDVMVPSRYVEVRDLPRLPNGKIDRRQLETFALDAEEAECGSAAPATPREETLVALWQGLLGRTTIGVTDNFFELGGHSLLVVEMIDCIERDHGVALTVADVFQHPTVRDLAGRIEAQRPAYATDYAHLFPIQPGGERIPFIFCVPHFFSGMLASRFRGKRPVYGLRGVSLRPEGNAGRWPTMAALGEDLVEEIRRRFPGQACIVAGYSFGATMAVEAVRLMEESGLPIERLYLIAPMPLDFYRLGPLRMQIGALRQPVDELSPWQALRLFARDNNPLTRRPYRRAWLLLGVRPWRRAVCLLGRVRRALGLPLTPRILHADVRVERFRLHGQYRPRPIRTPTVIFNAIEPDTDAAATWRPWFDGSLTVCDIPDPHLDDDAVARAQEIILEHLSDLEDVC